MREIKFRGKSKNTGEWVYGDLIQTKKLADGNISAWIKPHSFLGLGAKSTATENFIQVDPKTIGQFTGLKDKNGVEIYHKSILKDGIGIFYLCEIGGYFSLNGAGFGVHFLTYGDESEFAVPADPFGIQRTMEVVGNFYENPELLEENS